ncbi:toxin-antitoxin system HicB family antitoxin [Tissierella praeacuta]|uniref:toxin-antitoxin system HicB family antitoxin n=1 Tax=Tissierella praeacuta TaxID=43131 RepID=UPI001048645E|nr:toxin-antitoxin system HicB family antitoxin [Tissierella praeacuta]TCU75832.1 HicB-like protein involved in pilus formation [Tissierella praeacuta]
MTAKKRLTLRIPIKLDEKLSKESDKLGISKNSLILQMLWNETNNLSIERR